MKSVIYVILIFLMIVLCIGGLSYATLEKHTVQKFVSSQKNLKQLKTSSVNNSSPMAIQIMREKAYPGSQIVIEQMLANGSNYHRYLVSYHSDDLKIYGLLTVPDGKKPINGWPVILFNHGYISPAEYSTENSYRSMTDPLSAAGFIVFKPDYRGNGNSEGIPTQPYLSPDYITDSMNALSSIKQYKDANPQKIGVFGHSMGGNITLHELVITHDFKAAEFMAGVVGDETGILHWWDHRIAAQSIVGNDLDTSYVIEQMMQAHGKPGTNPTYWNPIDPTEFINFITTPIQIQVGTADEDVPMDFSTSLRDSLQRAGKSVAYHTYPGADHNLSPNLSVAMAEAIAFFNRQLH